MKGTKPPVPPAPEPADNEPEPSPEEIAQRSAVLALVKDNPFLHIKKRPFQLLCGLSVRAVEDMWAVLPKVRGRVNPTVVLEFLRQNPAAIKKSR